MNYQLHICFLVITIIHSLKLCILSIYTLFRLYTLCDYIMYICSKYFINFILSLLVHACIHLFLKYNIKMACVLLYINYLRKDCMERSKYLLNVI